ncbi:fumarylacetoacetate hydrolase family protein [Thermovirga sp.]|uniref:fumarylacetoacetate hydrolase family protein n=1 Tax=Thermovirga sp. TaxID=2699834 RepID=UPI0025D03DE6|nr:fumarylacetoacetate hydrolase family protein [Thermovirga sp.]MBO8154051.1 fumarylacetoacetate hydrolase family protein [Thermovirga sp.]
MKKYLRFCLNGETQEALTLDEENIYALEGSIFGIHDKGKFLCRVDEIQSWLPPTDPTKIVAVGLNYTDHAEETGYPIPKEPLLFLKPSTCVVAHKDKVLLPEASKRVDYEAELAIVIAKKAKDISPKDAEEYILGYSCFNDVTARDLQSSDVQWTRSKSFDTFGPYGPWIEMEIDPSNLKVQMIKNGQVVQESNTRHFIFPVPELVSYISKVMTLLPGDVIITGTPSGIGPVQPNDTMEVHIEKIGSLVNFVDKKV